MLEKLMQAALITFLLQIIAVLSNTNSIQPKVVSAFAEISGPVISSNFRVLEQTSYSRRRWFDLLRPFDQPRASQAQSVQVAHQPGQEAAGRRQQRKPYPVSFLIFRTSTMATPRRLSLSNRLCLIQLHTAISNKLGLTH